MDTIILNRMYAGSYLEENIGHEVINLFKADNESNYIYVNKDGRINEKYNNSVKAIILVKHVEKGVLEVVAKAEDLEQIYYKKKGYKNKDDRYEAEVKEENAFIEREQIAYGGVLLTKIYKKGDSELKITFKANKLRKVKEPVFLIEDETKTYKYENHYRSLPKKHFSTQSLKMYYPNDDELEDDYEVLDQLLDNPEIWEEENTTEEIKSNESNSDDSHEGFLSVIKKENDELVFSNLFSYIFNAKKDVFKDFAKEVLDVEDFGTDYKISREEGNIDLLIENEDKIIIIENKVKSKINGINSESTYDKIESQLSKYVEYARKEYCKEIDTEECSKKLNFCIFTPDYNQINLENYKDGEKYKPIKYSQIRNFYLENEDRMEDVKYFEEFLDALEIHTRSTDDTRFENMKRQFMKRILESKKNSN